MNEQATKGYSSLTPANKPHVTVADEFVVGGRSMAVVQRRAVDARCADACVRRVAAASVKVCMVEKDAVAPKNI
jgi:hypothetical protein